MSNAFNPQSLFNLVQESAQYATNESIYLKMGVGVHRLRICPPWNDEGTPVMLCVNHNNYKNKDGQLRMPLCYRYAFGTQQVAMKLKNKNVLTQQDLAVYGKVGCIYCKISEVIVKTQGKKANTFYARPSYKWNAVDRQEGKVKVWSTSQKLLENLTMFASAYPQMFNVDDGFDMMVNVAGEGLQRKYTLNVIPTPCPLGIDLTQNPLNDLDQVLADGYTNFSQAIEIITATMPQMISILGLNGFGGQPQI